MFDLIADNALAVAVTVPRITAAFLLLPLLSGESLPPLARNSLFVSLAIAIFPLASQSQDLDVGLALVPLLAKEIFIGAVLGLTFASIFWALSTAGSLIDATVGSSFVMVLDPVQGHQSSIYGTFFAQIANWVFMASGAFIVFLDVLLVSYEVWPIGAFAPTLDSEGMAFFSGRFGYIMTTAILLSAPVIVIMMLADATFGMLNRYAQQLQVFTMSIPIKQLLAAWLVGLTLGLMIEHILRRILDNEGLLDQLRSVF